MKYFQALVIFILLAGVLMACQAPIPATPTRFLFASATQAQATVASEPPMSTPEPPTPTTQILIPTTQAVPDTATPTPEPTPTSTTLPETPLPATAVPEIPATPDPNQGLGEIRFEDPLDGSSGWLWGYAEADVVRFSVDGSSVLARLEGMNKGWRISLGPDSFVADDQQVQLTARSEACGEKDEWGLLFRGALNSNNKFNGYVFKLNCAGQVSVDLMKSNKGTPLLGWTPASGAVAGAGATNTLLVWSGESEMRFYVNGVYVATLNDSTYPSGEYGLYVNGRSTSNAQFRFTNLRVFDVSVAE